MSAQTIPELALSSTSESSSSYQEVEYNPATEGPWVDDQDEQDVEDQLEEVVPPPVLTPWNASDWDDMALVGVWAAAKEEYDIHHDPAAPYVPFKADADLVELSKQHTKDSWKIRLQAREQLEREKEEASGLPPVGTKATSSLWYSSLFRPPRPPLNRKKPVKKPKLAPTHHNTSPDAYTPQSPTFQPVSPSSYASTPASSSQLPPPPSLSLDSSSAVAIENWDASWTGEGGEEEDWEYDDDENEDDRPYTGVQQTVQLEFGGGGSGGHWDDEALVEGWEREKREWEVSPVAKPVGLEPLVGTRLGHLDSAFRLADSPLPTLRLLHSWQAIHGKSKSWLDQAMEDAAAAAAATTAAPPTAAPVLDKVAKRNLARFGRVENPAVEGGGVVQGQLDEEGLSYN